MNRIAKLVAGVILFVATVLTYRATMPIHFGDTEATVPRLEITDETGRVILCDTQMTHYEWSTHKIKLQAGTVLHVPEEGENSFSRGVPFKLNANGVCCYQGIFTASWSSFAQNCTVIDVYPLYPDKGHIRIELGYPSSDYFRGQDPRGDERVRSVLKALGKLLE